jgi:Spy/CpxP family protein refolding chaperone
MFLVGAVAGFGVTYLDFGSKADSTQERRGDSRPTPVEITEKLNQKANLELTGEQRARMEELFAQSQREIEQIEERSRQEIWDVRLRVREKFREVLEPEQFDRLEAYFQSRHARRSGEKKE